MSLPPVDEAWIDECNDIKNQECIKNNIVGFALSRQSWLCNSSYTKLPKATLEYLKLEHQ